VPAVDDLLEEGRADGIDKVRGEDPARLHVDLIRIARLFVIVRHARIVEVAPEFGGVNARILDLRQRQTVRVDIVHREEAGNAHAPRRAGNQPGHPVVAVDQIGLYRRNDVVDHFARKGQRQLGILVLRIAVDRVAIIEAAVLGQMDARVGQAALVDAQLVTDQLSHLHMKHAPVVRQRHVDIGTEIKQRRHQRRGDIRQTAGFGGQPARHIAHAGRQVGDFRSDDQDTRLAVIRHVAALLLRHAYTFLTRSTTHPAVSPHRIR